HSHHSTKKVGDNTAITEFIYRELFNNDKKAIAATFETVLHFYHQSLNGAFLTALNTAILLPNNIIAVPDFISNLFRDTD
ncbi:hypothetical protein NL533_35405, partial [Klebsiella pneumoniae]|nr:hypothetical protein [Klebsiella pneumoniae]